MKYQANFSEKKKSGNPVFKGWYMNEMEYRTIGSALAGGYRAAVYCRLSKKKFLSFKYFAQAFNDTLFSLNN